MNRSHSDAGRLPRSARRVLPGAAAALAVALGGCGDGDAEPNGGLGDPPSAPSPQEPVHPLPPGKPDKRDRGAGRDDRPGVRMARCPPNRGNCSVAVGTVLYVESVDADGDGDLHVVATATRGDAVTGGGLVVFDVSRALRPARDPGPGDVVTGAGPVYKGSYGQSQIEVDEFRVARR